MWAYKSVVILVTGDQPDYWFELALVWFGLSILLLVYALKGRVNRFARVLVVLGWVALIGGGTAGVAYVMEGDDGPFGPAALVTMLSMVIVLFLVGGDVRRNQLLPKYSFAPGLLAWLFIVSVPLGAVLSGIDERLLEIGLLVTVIGWVTLAAGELGRPRAV
jgi:hypothetical protein